MLETVGQSLRHSCRTPIKCQGISLPLDRQSYSRRLLGFLVKSKTLIYYTCSTGQASVSIHLFNFAETCGFINQSLSSILCQLKNYKPLLLPKLRSHFAEFLQHNYLKHLNFLNTFTCVGLQYGLNILSYFLKNIVKTNLNTIL